MKILVTGTAGFIGFHLAKKLLKRGDEVIALALHLCHRKSEDLDFFTYETLPT